MRVMTDAICVINRLIEVLGGGTVSAKIVKTEAVTTVAEMIKEVVKADPGIKDAFSGEETVRSWFAVAS